MLSTTTTRNMSPREEARERDVHKDIEINSVAQGGVMNSEFSYYRFNLQGRHGLVTIRYHHIVSSTIG